MRSPLTKASLALCLGLVLGAIGVANAGEEEKVLNVYNWSDYIAPDTIANFEKETGIKVRYDNFDSNETLHANWWQGKQVTILLFLHQTGPKFKFKVVCSKNWIKQS